MEKNVRYATIGLFVILSVSAITFFVFWLAKYGFDEDKNYYKTYFFESVSGLKVSSPVRIQGIDIGEVRQIKLDHENPSQIEVIFATSKNTPIKQDCRSVLNSQGIAGIAFIELKECTKNSPLLDTSAQNIAVIESKPSFMSKLSSQASDTAKSLNKIIAKIDALLSEKNSQNISQLIANLNTISLNLSSQTKKIGDILDSSKSNLQDFSSLQQELKQSSQKLNLLLDESQKIAHNINDHKSVEKLNAAIQSSLAVLENSNQTLEKIQNLSENANELVAQIKSEPQKIIFGNKPKEFGPGENNE